MVAEDGRPPELGHEGTGELFEGVRQDHHLGAGPQLGQERCGAGQGRQGGDHLLDPSQRETVAIQDVEPVAHECVVVGLVAGGAAQLVDAGPLGHRHPDLGNQHPFQVQGDDRLLRRAHGPQSATAQTPLRGRPPIWHAIWVDGHSGRW
jgi:hypothetical protein